MTIGSLRDEWHLDATGFIEGMKRMALAFPKYQNISAMTSAVCRVLGMDPATVMDLSLSMGVDAVPTVTFTRELSDEECRKIATALRVHEGDHSNGSGRVTWPQDADEPIIK